MAGRKERNVDMSSTAAYSASQPLLTELQTAIAMIDRQRIQLAYARDTVKNIHVKIVPPDDPKETMRHEQYMDSIVLAWRDALASYSKVLGELCNITAPNEAEGREAGSNYQYFRLMAETVTAARRAAMSYTVTHYRAKLVLPKLGKRSRDSTVSEDSLEYQERPTKKKTEMAAPTANQEPVNGHARSAAAPPGKKRKQGDMHDDEVGAEQPTKARRLSKNTRHDNNGDTVPWEKNTEQPDVPGANQDRLEKKARKAEKVRQMRGKEKGEEGGAAAETSTRSAADSPTAANGVHEQDFISLDNGIRVPGVVYEDVSEQVAERLRIKEQKRQAKKKEKKRRRNSEESPAPVGPSLEDNEATAERQTKKSRTGEHEREKTVPVVGGTHSKRKQDGVAVEDLSGGGRKKAKSWR